MCLLVVSSSAPLAEKASKTAEGIALGRENLLLSACNGSVPPGLEVTACTCGQNVQLLLHPAWGAELPLDELWMKTDVPKQGWF